jgi:hypothetical protein
MFIFDVDLTKIKIQASPIAIGDRQAVVEEKRTTTRGKLKLAFPQLEANMFDSTR